MIHSNDVLLELFALKNEAEYKFLGGTGNLDDVQIIDELIEKRTPKNAGYGPIATAPVRELESGQQPNTSRPIDKKDGDFYHEGRPIQIRGRDTLYFAVFDTVFNLMPDGGEKKYTEIEKALRRRLVRGSKIRPLKGAKMRDRIRHNLTSNKNGFFRYANISNATSEGQAIIETRKGEGIVFRNARG